MFDNLTAQEMDEILFSLQPCQHIDTVKHGRAWACIDCGQTFESCELEIGEDN